MTMHAFRFRLFPEFLRLLSGAVSLLVLTTLALAGDPISRLSEGAPHTLGRQLPESSYVSFKAKRLAHARVVWLNFPLLKEMGIEVPAEGLTREFENAVLDAFAYMVPQGQDPAEFYTELFKTFYADRYGGTGIGVNWGSARAGIAGEIQIKGIGQTPLLGDGQQFDHAHGGASFEESIREALMGEVAHATLPYGANRVIAILDTGTFTHWKDGGKEPRALIIRQDAVRPAHFMNAQFGAGAAMARTDPSRVLAAEKFLDRAAPRPEHFSAEAWEGLRPGQKFKLGYFEFARRLAVQYATATAESFYHGGTSPSNVEISGRFIDYGTMTAQPQHGAIQVLAHVQPFWETEELKSTLLVTPFQTMLSFVPAQWGPDLPLKSELSAQFDRDYEQSLRVKFIEIAGVPPELSEELLRNAQVAEFADRLIQLAKEPLAGRINVDKAMPSRTGKHDIRKLLLDLSPGSLDHSTFKMPNFLPVLLEEFPGELERKTFLNQYARFHQALIDRGRVDGVTPEALQTYIHESVKYRAREIPDLYRPNMRAENDFLIKNYKETGSRDAIWQSMDRRIQSGKRVPLTESGYRLVLPVENDRLDDLAAFKVFDARKNAHEIRIEVPAAGQATYRVLGNVISAGELPSLSVLYSADGWKNSANSSLRKIGAHYQLTLPMADAESKSSRVEFVLQGRDARGNGRWYRRNGSNAVIDAGLSLHSECGGLVQKVE